MVSVVEAFDGALAGAPAALLRSDGATTILPVARWHAAAAGEDHWLLDRCHGPTIDLGCGPGRLLEALLQNGVPALGVDVSSAAVQHCVRRGRPALQLDVLGPLPGQGRWCHVLLVDGNLGIGGDPVRLLQRVSRLLQPGGTALVEVERHGSGLWRGHARVRSQRSKGTLVPWSTVGIDAMPALAHKTGFHTTAEHTGERYFVELTLDRASLAS